MNEILTVCVRFMWYLVLRIYYVNYILHRLNGLFSWSYLLFVLLNILFIKEKLFTFKNTRNTNGSLEQNLYISRGLTLQFLSYSCIYRVSQEECEILRESVPYVKLYRYNPKHLYPMLNGYGDNGHRSLKLWQLLHTYWLPNTY